MSYRNFSYQLTGVALAVWVLLLITHQIPGLGEEQDFSWMTWGAFILISILMFMLGKWAALDRNQKLFISMSIFLGGSKMLFSVVWVIVYTTLYIPKGRGFVIPFFLIYLCFTIFETYFMMKLSYEKKPQPAELKEVGNK